MAKDPHQKREPGPLHEQLTPFIGRWKVKGKNAPLAPDAPSTEVTGEETYEWLPGGFFVLNRWDRRLGHDGRHIGTGILGVGPSEQAYTSDSFDNLGYHRHYELSVAGRVWTFRGEFERAVLTFGPSAADFHVQWELSKDGSSWQPLCELQGTKST